MPCAAAPTAAATDLPCQLVACLLRLLQLLLFSPGPLVFPAGLTRHIAGHGSGSRRRIPSCIRVAGQSARPWFRRWEAVSDSSLPAQAADDGCDRRGPVLWGGYRGRRVLRQLAGAGGAGVASHSRFRAALLLSDWCPSCCSSPNVRRPGRLVSAAKGPHVSSLMRGFAQEGPRSGDPHLPFLNPESTLRLYLFALSPFRPFAPSHDPP